MASFPEMIIDEEIRDSFRVSRLPLAIAGKQQLVSATYHRIFLILEGNGFLQADSKQYNFAKNEVLLISKGQLFQISGSTSLTGYSISFGDCFWERTPASTSNCKAVLFNNAAFNQQIILNENARAGLVPLFELLIEEYNTDDYPNKPDAMAALLKVIMIKLANLNTRTEEPEHFDNRTYHKFLELVSTSFTHTHKVEDFAIQLGVSSRKLSDLCKSKTGNGAKEIINEYIIAEAKRALQFSNKPVKEIAYQLSFATPEQFSHFFKKNTSLSPAEFRNHFVNFGR